MSNGWLRLWLLSLIRSSNFHVMQKKNITCGCLCSLQMISILQSYKALFRQPDVICTKRLLCQTYFFIKSCLSHTFPRAVQSVTQTERVHLSLPIYGMLFSPLLSLRQYNAGMVDSCLLIQCHGLFPLSVCFDVSIQRHRCMSQRAFSFKAHSQH